MTLSPRPSPVTRQASWYFAFGGALLLVTSGTLTGIGLFTEGFILATLGIYVSVAVIALPRIGTYHPFSRFGTANSLTLVRLGIVALLGGLASEVCFPELTPSSGVAWAFFALAVVAICLDGLDGYAARREQLTSPFGGRFDMEVDALQILLLCIIAVAIDKAGLWVLIGGALRYAYEVAAIYWPALRRPLSPSFRRKLISVIEGATLSALLAPIITPPFSTLAAAIALILLIFSFGLDVILLTRAEFRDQKAMS